MPVKPPDRLPGIGKQAFALRGILPECSIHLRSNTLTAVAHIQPAPACRRYRVQLQYDYGGTPEVRVLAPELRLHHSATKLPHIYPGDFLCLHLANQWQPTMLLANTTVPWTSEWLYYYEIWLVTGQWHGGGNDPVHAEPTANP
ncbi:hypothetical protein ABZW96_35945 [Nocardia sp. NPDC004168]|uniref:hypothetical protein n=1 Tax=Nocardia sp. NPDC004168 TaxID=3154452 RepID=UPI0033A05372